MRARGYNSSALLAVGVVVSLSAGCGSSGPPVYPVTGSVSYAGRPVPTGAVVFFPVSGGAQASGVVEGDGRFALASVAGEHKVVVLAPRPLPVAEVNATNWEQAFRTKAEPYVPGIFGDPETTPLKFTVTADGENLCNLKIEQLKPRRRF